MFFCSDCRSLNLPVPWVLTVILQHCTMLSGPVSQIYLWGIFCHVKHKKLSCDMENLLSSKTPVTSVRNCNQSNNHQKGNSTEIHSTGETKSSPAPLFDPSPGSWKLRSEVHGKGPSAMSAPKDVRRPISSGSPPGFPRHSPGNEGSSSSLASSMTSLMCKVTRPTMDHQVCFFSLLFFKL